MSDNFCDLPMRKNAPAAKLIEKLSEYLLNGLFSSSDPSIFPLECICKWYLVAQ